MRKIALLFSSCILLTAAKAQLANSGMETWRTYISNSTTLEIPDDWFGGDSTIYALAASFPITPQQTLFKESTEKHGGTYSVKLVTADFIGVKVPGLLANANPIVDPSALTTGDIFGNLTYEGGTAVTQRYNSLVAWVKYIPSGSDVAVIEIRAIKTGAGAGGADSVIGSGTSYLPPTPGFTEVTVPVTYKDASTIPDKMIVTFLSSDPSGENGTTPQTGSTLYVDDASLSMTTNVKEVFAQVQIGNIYPNPATTELNIAADNSNELSVHIFNTSGVLMRHATFKNNTHLSLGNFASGIYFYEIKDVKDKKIQRGSFSVVR